MELDSHGGNTALVYPVVEALARGSTVELPEMIRLLGVPCQGFRCRVRRWVRPQDD
jgi:hypothetical protein